MLVVVLENQSQRAGRPFYR